MVELIVLHEEKQLSRVVLDILLSDVALQHVVRMGEDGDVACGIAVVFPGVEVSIERLELPSCQNCTVRLDELNPQHPACRFGTTFGA